MATTSNKLAEGRGNQHERIQKYTGCYPKAEGNNQQCKFININILQTLLKIISLSCWLFIKISPVYALSDLLSFVLWGTYACSITFLPTPHSGSHKQVMKLKFWFKMDLYLCLKKKKWKERILVAHNNFQFLSKHILLNIILKRWW